MKTILQDHDIPLLFVSGYKESEIVEKTNDIPFIDML
jgi:hypothetical protein